MLYEKLHRWAIETDTNQETLNLASQVKFIVDFEHLLKARLADMNLSPMAFSPFHYYTRIFHPERDHMGAYVRLHFFVEVDRAEQEVFNVMNDVIDSLQLEVTDICTGTVRQEVICPLEEAKLKGFNEQDYMGYYALMHEMSQVAVRLWEQNPAQPRKDSMMHAVAHNWFNLMRGYAADFLELEPGVFKSLVRM